jgi:hypothetical protein
VAGLFPAPGAVRCFRPTDPTEDLAALGQDHATFAMPVGPVVSFGKLSGQTDGSQLRPVGRAIARCAGT